MMDSTENLIGDLGDFCVGDVMECVGDLGDELEAGDGAEPPGGYMDMEEGEVGGETGPVGGDIERTLSGLCRVPLGWKADR